MEPIVPTDWQSASSSIIKVVGVGGGGCNAVSYMFDQGITGCSFVVCNTDSQALRGSRVPVKIQLGEGLGAGTNPDRARSAAIESRQAIEEALFDDNTKMLFITAGLGGGTGTGATPVIASMARERGLLVVAVVTIPFESEGSDVRARAIDGIHELEHKVDSLLIINNEKLYDCFPDFLVQEAFPKADEVLATAVKGIVEIIDVTGTINIDFQDIRTMMKNSGMALMGCGVGTGDGRIEDAVRGAFESPLLNDFDLKTAKHVLVNITVPLNEHGVQMKELQHINNLIATYTGGANNFKRGLVYDRSEDVGDKVKITAVATGFKICSLLGAGISDGNVITVSEDFVYDRSSDRTGEGISLHADSAGYDDSGYFDELELRFDFSDGRVPVLATDDRARISALEKTPSIKRKPSRKI